MHAFSCSLIHSFPETFSFVDSFKRVRKRASERKQSRFRSHKSCHISVHAHQHIISAKNWRTWQTCTYVRMNQTQQKMENLRNKKHGRWKTNEGWNTLWKRLLESKLVTHSFVFFHTSIAFNFLYNFSLIQHACECEKNLREHYNHPFRISKPFLPFVM